MIRTSALYEVLKRLADIGFSISVLVVLSPLLLAVAALIKLDSRGPVFYVASRTGLRGRPFRMIKFRSMAVGAEKAGPSSTSDEDPRITRFGQFVRKSKLDEIPQLINVLLGDMSLIGPRPDVQTATDLYTEEQKLVLEVRPGVVDFGSLWNRDEGEILKGSADPDGDYLRHIFPTKVSLSLEYVRTRSLRLDLKITVATFAAIYLRIDPKWCLPYGMVDIPEYTREAIMGRPAEELVN
ncbi:MAG: sugar transferase [Armatimonadetes bacterium]|nr:sugar transferase [Armatimonadota bacterium]